MAKGTDTHATQHNQRTPQARMHLGHHRDVAQKTTPQGSDALGHHGRPAGPVAGPLFRDHWSEPGQVASGTMANVTQSLGNNR